MTGMTSQDVMEDTLLSQWIKL